MRLACLLADLAEFDEFSDVRVPFLTKNVGACERTVAANADEAIDATRNKRLYGRATRRELLLETHTPRSANGRSPLERALLK